MREPANQAINRFFTLEQKKEMFFLYEIKEKLVFIMLWMDSRCIAKNHMDREFFVISNETRIFRPLLTKFSLCFEMNIPSFLKFHIEKNEE